MPTQTELQPVSITQLTQLIKQRLETEFKEVFVKGEVSNFRHQASGHLYFSLKDATSQISTVMFRGNASRLSCLPKEGDQVIVRGEVNVYLPRGQYQLIIRELFFVGVGELLVRLEQLKKALAARGWLAPEKKQPLPKHPQRIGVVTSPTGAAIQDMLNVLTRRHGGFHLILNPVRVQGAEAAGEIAAAIDHFNKHQLADVLIVGRGGGSIEDLWAFNEEIVARAIHESKIPIISAVGHETDITLADLVADVRAPTPSAAAEIVIAEKEGQLAYLSRTKAHLQRTLSLLLQSAMQRCDDMRDTIDGTVEQILEQRRLRLQGLDRQRRALSPLARIAHYRQQFSTMKRSIDRAISLDYRKERLKQLTNHLQSIDPRNLLGKGYSILFKEGQVIHSVKDVKPQQRLVAKLADGELPVEVVQ